MILNEERKTGLGWVNHLATFEKTQQSDLGNFRPAMLVSKKRIKNHKKEVEFAHVQQELFHNVSPVVKMGNDPEGKTIEKPVL